MISQHRALCQPSPLPRMILSPQSRQILSESNRPRPGHRKAVLEDAAHLLLLFRKTAAQEIKGEKDVKPILNSFVAPFVGPVTKYESDDDSELEILRFHRSRTVSIDSTHVPPPVKFNRPRLMSTTVHNIPPSPRGSMPSESTPVDQRESQITHKANKKFVGTNAVGPVRAVLRRKFSWKAYPELEKYLVEHRAEYLQYSSCFNYTSEQKRYNNDLTQGLIDLAAEEGYVFEEFTFAAIRDRIRCYYKSCVQAAKKKRRRR